MSELALVARDGWFFKDGRGWPQLGGGRGTALEWPFPSSVRGALRTAYGFARLEHERTPWSPSDWQARTAGVTLQALLALRRDVHDLAWAPRHRVWPAPADTLCVRGETRVHRLDPRPLPPGVRTLGRDDDGAREALWWPWLGEPTGKPGRAPRAGGRRTISPRGCARTR